MKVSNSVKALVLSTRETSTLLLHPSCQKCFGKRGILSEKACLSLFCASPIFISPYRPTLGLPRQLSGKEPTCHSGDSGSIPGSGRSPAEGNNNLLQYSCLEKRTEREAWWATVHGTAKSQTQLSDETTTFPPHSEIFLAIC